MLSNIAVIPAYNESRTIGPVVSQTLNHVDRVIVVDDGSTDTTSQEARKNGALVVRKHWNNGPGATTLLGIQIVLTSYPDLATIILIDGDGQHDPDSIPDLLQALREGCDMAIGTRSLSRDSMPLSRWAVNRSYCILRNACNHRPIQDAESGFRALSRRAAALLTTQELGFGFCEEMAIKARALGLRITEVPVSTRYGDDFCKYPVWSNLSRGASIGAAILRWRWRYEWKPGARRQPSTSGTKTSHHSPETEQPPSCTG